MTNKTFQTVRVVFIVLSILAVVGGAFCLYMHLSIDTTQERKEREESKKNEKQLYLIGTILCFVIAGLGLLAHLYYRLKFSKSPNVSNLSNISKTCRRSSSASPELSAKGFDDRLEFAQFFAVVKEHTPLRDYQYEGSSHSKFLEPGDIVTVTSIYANGIAQVQHHPSTFGYVRLTEIERLPNQKEARDIVYGDKKCGDVDLDPPKLARVVTDIESSDPLSFENLKKGDIVNVHKTNICNQTHPNVQTLSQISRIDNNYRSLVPSSRLDFAVQICDVNNYMKALFDDTYGQEMEGTVTRSCVLYPYDSIHVYPFELIVYKRMESGEIIAQTPDGWTGILDNTCITEDRNEYLIQPKSWVTDGASIYQVMTPLNRKDGTYEAKQKGSWFGNDTIDARQVNPIARLNSNVVVEILEENGLTGDVTIKRLRSRSNGDEYQVKTYDLKPFE